jgi:hypothetical protein
MAGTHDFVAVSRTALAPSFDNARASYQFFSPDRPCPIAEDGSGLVYTPHGREATILISRLPGCDASVGVTFSNTTGGSTIGGLFFNTLRGPSLLGHSSYSTASPISTTNISQDL